MHLLRNSIFLPIHILHTYYVYIHTFKLWRLYVLSTFQICVFYGWWKYTIRTRSTIVTFTNFFSFFLNIYLLWRKRVTLPNIFKIDFIWIKDVRLQYLYTYLHAFLYVNVRRVSKCNFFFVCVLGILDRRNSVCESDLLHAIAYACKEKN